MLRPKKVGTLPVGNGSDEVKQTNEIKYAPILLAPLLIRNKDITRDALHTQTEFARYLVEQRKAHYYLSIKANQPTLLEDIKVQFSNENSPADYEDRVSVEHGRIEIRRIWVTSRLNDYVKFPHVAQVYRIYGNVSEASVISLKSIVNTNDVSKSNVSSTYFDGFLLMFNALVFIGENYLSLLILSFYGAADGSALCRMSNYRQSPRPFWVQNLFFGGVVEV